MTMRMHRCAGLLLRRRTALLQAARRHSHEARLRRIAARPPSPAVLLHRAGVHPRHAVHLRSRAVLRHRPVRAAVPRRPVRIHRARQSADLPEPRLLHRPERDLPAVRSARAAPLHRSVRAVLLLRSARAVHLHRSVRAVHLHRFARMDHLHRSVRAEPAPRCVRTALLPRIARAAHRLPYADLPAAPPHPAAALLSVRTATAEQCARTILLLPTGKPLLRV